MKLNGKTVLLCDCNRTMPLDGAAIAKACGGEAPTVHSLLCRAQLGAFEAAIKAGGPVLVGCTQEAPLFTETRAEDGLDGDLQFVNIRERAGWSEEAEHAGPKIAALLAEAAIDVASPPGVTLNSQGMTLIYGRDESAIEVAKQLSNRLQVTVLLTKPAADLVPPRVTEMPIFKGTIARASGHVGAFEIAVDDYAAALPFARRALAFEPARDGASSRCDLILDLTGGTPLFPAPQKRDGYFRPDPGDPAAVQRALLELTDLVGEFEKPRYVAFTAALCAHGRNRKTGCTRCLDVCPTGAITSGGDHVVIDPHVCAGCGSCASVCPTGASAYAMPAAADLWRRLQTLLATYLAAGGKTPVLLVHDGRHGETMIDLIARQGRGLPAHVLPFAVNEVTQLGFDFFTVALAYGAAEIRLLADPAKRDELAGLAGQVGLAETAASGLGHGSGRVAVIDSIDPEIVEAELYRRPAPSLGPPATFLPMGGKRALSMLALRHLHAEAPAPVEILPLTAGSPFGALAVKIEGCTLCLSCVGTCPTGALIDNPDRPMLRFIEDACVQCGLCKAVCPEKVISLAPRFNFSAEARAPALIKEEAPAQCLRCGKPFGTQSAIDRVIEKLADKHWMFKDPGMIDRIRMCEDCRLVVQAENAIDPFAGPARPQTRTTEDYLRERERAKKLNS